MMKLAGLVGREIRDTCLKSFPNLYGLFQFRGFIYDTFHNSTFFVIFITAIVIVIFAVAPDTN